MAAITDDSPLKVAVEPEDTFGVSASLEAAGAELVGVAEAEALVWSAPADADGLARSLDGSRIRWVQVTSAGVERFWRAGLLDGSRLWTSARGLYGRICAEHVLALTLSALRRVHVHVRSRDNSAAKGFTAPERLLSTQRVLVFGTGGIGSASARLFQAFGARVTGVNRSGRPADGFDAIVPASELVTVIGEADIVVLCAPLTSETEGLFDARMLGRMRAGAWLVNVARGEVVVTDDLVAALSDGTLGGACLDVTTPDPLPPDHPLWDCDNTIITPHVAATWAMSRELFADRVGRNARRLMAGEALEGVVDQEHGY